MFILWIVLKMSYICLLLTNLILLYLVLLFNSLPNFSTLVGQVQILFYLFSPLSLLQHVVRFWESAGKGPSFK